MQYWSALDILKQVCGELGLPTMTTAVASDNVQGIQLLAALNAAGSELLTYYPWQQLVGEWTFSSIADQDQYNLPSDWAYFVDQTQWDRTNHWPMLGPKTPQEWAWLKGGLVASFPRTRYRVMGNKFVIFPKPTSTDPVFTFAMEYIKGTWVQSGTDYTYKVTLDGDIVMYDPWLMIKFTKLKFYQLKGFDITHVKADFMRVYDSLTGKDSGAPTLSLTPIRSPLFIGPQNIPDGNWNVEG